MKPSQWRKNIFYMTDKEIIQYYGLQWLNCNHMKSYIKVSGILRYNTMDGKLMYMYKDEKQL